MMRIPVFLATSLALASSVLAQNTQPGQSIDATLSSGETIRGTVVSDDGTTLVVTHPILGQLSIPKSSIKTLVDTPPAAPPPPPVPPPPPPPKPDPDSFFKGWTGTVELGLNGAQGNTENFGVRVGASAKRETTKTMTLANFFYSFSSSNSETSEDKGEANIRNDWKTGTPWRFYALGRLEYDKFQDWDWRLSAFGGVGYELIKNEKTLLLPRFGAGATQTFGGTDDQVTPELDFGLDWEQKIDDRQKFVVTADYYPSLLNFSDYRARIKGGYEILVDPTTNLSLKLGVEDNYDSSPGDDSKKNDIIYYLMMVYNW